MKLLTIIALGAALTLPTACHTSVKPLAPINTVENFCKQGVPKGPGILSIIASIGDQAPVYTSHSTKSVQAQYKKRNGAIAHWDKLELYAPTAAKAHGETDGYLHITQAAVDDAPEGAVSRPVLLFMRGAQGQGWYTASAFDVQSVCIVGSRQS